MKVMIQCLNFSFKSVGMSVNLPGYIHESLEMIVDLSSVLLESIKTNAELTFYFEESME